MYASGCVPGEPSTVSTAVVRKDVGFKGNASQPIRMRSFCVLAPLVALTCLGFDMCATIIQVTIIIADYYNC
jgi:hypothetical protein